MTEGNPLVAAPVSQTTGVTGIGILESAQDLSNGVKDGSWVEGGLGALGVGLEVLSMVIDPLGTLAQYGVAWLIEHVRPLKEALDWLAGDPPVIQSFSDTWANVAAEVGTIAGDLKNEVDGGTAGWSGQAADTYRGAGAEQADALAGAASLADGISAGVMIMGTVVGFVREMVRDIVAELVGKLITWALEAACTLGFATPLIAAQATTAISSAVTRISDFIRKLVKTVGNVSPRIRRIIDKLDEIIQKLGKLGRKFGGDGTSPSAAPGGGGKVDTPDLNGPDAPSSPGSPNSPDGTSPSGARGADGSGDIKDNIGRPRDNAVPAENLRCEKDPVDVATGRMVMSQTDVELLAALPLVIRRVHLSSYRAGRCFGPSWASTLDQRVEVEADGVYFAADDGTLQHFADPAPGFPVRPDEGPRRLLERTVDGAYRLTDADGQRTLHFAEGGRVRPVAAITDRNGNRIEFVHDDSGTPVEIQHSGGYRIRVESVDGRVTALHLSGRGSDEILLKRYGYEDARLTEVAESGDPIRFDYDPAGRVTGWTDRNGAWYRYVYDDAGRVVRTEGPQGALSGTMEYDLENRITYSVDSVGARTAFHMNEANQVVREIAPLGGETRFEWDRYDRLLSRTDPLGRTESYRYDDDGNLVAVTRPDGSQRLFEYDDQRRPVSSVAPDGSVTRRVYDEHGNVTAFVDAAGGVTRLAYDERGALARLVDPLGNVRRIANDEAGLPVAVTDPLGATTSYERDQFGRVVAVIDPNEGVTRYRWTVGGRLIWRSLPDGSVERWAYDGEGNPRGYADPVGQVTHTKVTHFDLPTVEERPDGTRLEFAYDTELRLVGVTNELGLTWRREYDPAGNLVRETDFDGRTITYRYDAAGQLVERTNGAGETTVFTYDSLGKVVERRNSTGSATFAYDVAGRLIHATEGGTELSFQRDAFGRIVAETCNGRTVVSGYDPLGRRIRRRTPSGAESVWEYDPNDQPTALHTSGRTLRFDHDPAGHELRRTLGPNAVLAQQWNVNHQLVGQTINGPAGQVQHRSYAYRPDGLLSGVEDRLTGGRTFALDRAGRVTSVRGANWAERYTYDAAGNVSGMFGPGGSPGFADSGSLHHTGTLVRQAGKTRYEHDAQGRIVLRQRKRLSRKPETWQYSWDPEDRLTGVRTPDGVQWRYRYDPLGRRIAKERLSADGSQVVERIDFVWDGVLLAEQVHWDGRAFRATVWDYEPRRFRPVTQTERSWARDAPQREIDEHFYAIVTDLVGAPAELVNEHGGIAWFHRTSLWGGTVAEGRTGASSPLRFPGQYADPESGFHYNYFRHYDPATGSYASADPLGLDAGTNNHRYVANPLDSIDPLGLISCTLRSYADGLRGENQAGTPRVAAEYTSPSGRVHHGYAREGLTIPDELRAEMEQIAPLSNRHGACAEVNALARAYIDEGPDAIRGGSMEAVRVRPERPPGWEPPPDMPNGDPHGTPIDPCENYCQPLLRRLGIGW